MQNQPDSSNQNDGGTWNWFAANDPPSGDVPKNAQVLPPVEPTALQVKVPCESRRQPEAALDESRNWDQETPPLIDQGRMIFGKYRLIEKIGEGGMGSVWLVHNTVLGRKSALKLIKPEIAQYTIGWQRFEREAQLMTMINHPNAVAVYEFQRTPSMGYIEMEFARGRSLADILEEHPGRPMARDWTAQVLRQLCAVLQAAHGHVDERTGKPKPIIHRDLKPSNLMIVERLPRGEKLNLKVLDFGIAKMLEDESDLELTEIGNLIGTPAYMSPEQVRSGLESAGEKDELDGRSDLYSTGVLLYHLLTGVLPFRGSHTAVLLAHLTVAPPPMKESNPEANVAEAVEQVVMQCLEKDPAKRPRSAGELADRFCRACASGEPRNRGLWGRFIG